MSEYVRNMTATIPGKPFISANTHREMFEYTSECETRAGGTHMLRGYSTQVDDEHRLPTYGIDCNMKENYYNGNSGR